MVDLTNQYLRNSKMLFKEYLTEALALCISCQDAKPEMLCSANCSISYEYFLYGKRFIDEKYKKCINLCDKNSAEKKNNMILKCKNTCNEESLKDINDVDKLLKKQGFSDS